MEYDTDAVGKYHKKKVSDTSKSRRRSKHKHKYKPCLFEVKYPFLENYILEGGSYCTVCGKIGDTILDESPIREGKYLRSLTSEELIELYKGCQTFQMDGILVRYVPIADVKGGEKN